MSSKRKSIIKSGKGKADKTRKRLSFAADAEEKKTAEATKRESKRASQAVSGTPPALAIPSCKMTALGLCYDPKTSRGVPRQHNTTPMSQNTRQNYMSIQNLTPLSGYIDADVLITGGKIFAEKLKVYLMDAHDKQQTKMNLNITCEEDLPETVKAHFILALFFKDTHNSMKHLCNIVNRCTDGTLSSKRVMVVCVSSAEGCFKNVVDLEQFHSVLSTHQLVHITMKEQSRLDREEMNMMLELIQKSAAYHKGTSLLTDYAMQLDLRNYLMEDIIPQESALGITQN